MLLLPQFFFIKGILKLIFLNNFIPNILSPAITINSAANSWINPCIFIDIENTEPRAPIIPPSNVYEITLPRLYLSAVLKDDFLLTSKLSLSRVCVSIIPPHIPTQWRDDNNPTTNNIKSDAFESSEFVSYPTNELLLRYSIIITINPKHKNWLIEFL